jgi:hypothetical protein
MSAPPEVIKPLGTSTPRWAAVLYSIIAPPLAWSIQLMLAYVITAQTCYPTDHPRLAPPARAAHTALLVIDVVAIVLTIAAGAVALRIWGRSRAAGPLSLERVIEAGEDRERFLAAWGLISSLCFLAAIVFETIASSAPLCGP